MINITTTSISEKKVQCTGKKAKPEHFIPRLSIEIRRKLMKEHASMMIDEHVKKRRELVTFKKKKQFKFSSCGVESGEIERMQKNSLFVKKSSR